MVQSLQAVPSAHGRDVRRFGLKILGAKSSLILKSWNFDGTAADACGSVDKFIATFNLATVIAGDFGNEEGEGKICIAGQTVLPYLLRIQMSAARLFPGRGQVNV